MINNMIKLFYSEVVKAKINNMPNQEYELRNGVKKLRNVTERIDYYMFRLLKILVGVVILYTLFRMKVTVGIGALLIGLTYLIYKSNYENKLKQKIENLKENIEMSKECYINADTKKGINLLIVLLTISLLTGFNYFIIISFFIVLGFTIMSIYKVFK